MQQTALLDRLAVHHLEFPGFPDSFGEFRIFFISDIHRRQISNRLIHEIKGADAVIIGGDLTEKNVPFSRVKENIIKLKELAPVYFVRGNNDYEVPQHVLDRILLQQNVSILDNAAVFLESDSGETIALIGIEDISEERDRLDLALKADAVRDKSFNILVSHNPEVKDQLQEIKGHEISLVLSGHTHGGQIRLFGKGLYPPGKMIQEGDTIFLTSNGYGTSGLPLRLGAKPETHLLILRTGETVSAASQNIITIEKQNKRE
ncbi:metallophosphoesterase [Bacillus massiliglaciei]|uniref:metallophosphoesterase n=1 Tax=Bacillus massiliglaciei TaxID=1816693 RepID=UPI001F22752C|nr:metallophosphoesterase [Bacillus massiliglaciei]